MSVAFVLSGGGSLGAVQVGMVRALYTRGIRPDLWVGASVGSINATFLAARPATLETMDDLASVWLAVRRGDVFPLRAVTGFVGFFGMSDHLVPAGPVRSLLRSILGLERLEDSRVPVHVVATDAMSGRERLLSQGDAVQAVMASISLPGILPPVPWDGTLLCDGGVTNNAPISHAVELGASHVYVLPAAGVCGAAALPSSALGMVVHGLSLMLARHLMTEVARLRGHAHLVVLPPPCPQLVQPIDFSRAAELMAAGELSAHRHLDAVANGDVDPAALVLPTTPETVPP
ncbi:MAG: hypothetical protein RL199_1287 [Pseudomonadota bacterium]|jgi:NTE family protein